MSIIRIIMHSRNILMTVKKEIPNSRATVRPPVVGVPSEIHRPCSGKPVAAGKGGRLERGE